MTGYQAQVAAVIRAVAFHRPLTYSWFGRRVAPLPARVRAPLPAAAVRAHLLHGLRFQLYRDFYGPGGAGTPRPPPAPAPAGEGAFARRLAAANAGHGSWEGGWQVVAREDGAVEAVRNGLAVRLQAPDYRAAVSPPGPGAALEVRLPKELFSISPGYYMALGDAPAAANPAGPLLRLYWNVDPDGAILLLNELTAGLNAAGVPFQLKALSNPAAYSRADAAVLYVAVAHFDRVRPILTRSYKAVREHLAPAVPALTLALAPGLGLAEDPGPGQSFGLHRCGLLADALLGAHLAGHKAEAARLDAVAAHFVAAGLDLERPYLGPGSQGVYEMLIAPPSVRTRHRPGPPADDFAAVALGIGSRLAEEAIWYDERCNWVGVDPSEAPAGEGLAYRSLGPDLYAGTAGVGLFLVELWRVTGEPWARRAGQGALRQALGSVDAIPPADRLGLYTGWAGIALAAVRAGRLLGDEEMESSGNDLARRCTESRLAGANDLIAGRAGAILALLLLAAGGAHALLAVATELGDELIATATRAAAGWSWPPRAGWRGPGLTGLSHGAAGIGYALLELARVTGEARFRLAAEAAYAYERRWFDPARGNWADLRHGAGRSRASRAFASAWCHGAPGIALSRLRAAELLPEACYRAEARCALATTRLTVAAALPRPGADFSLCHGIAGLAEVLLAGAGAQDVEVDAWNEVALEAARTGATRYAAGAKPWPAGATGDTPALLVGQAGIGLFYLRRHDPATPSPLLPLTLAVPMSVR